MFPVFYSKLVGQKNNRACLPLSSFRPLVRNHIKENDTNKTNKPNKTTDTNNKEILPPTFTNPCQCEHCTTSQCILKRVHALEAQVNQLQTQLNVLKNIEDRCRSLEERYKKNEEDNDKPLLTVAEDNYFHVGYPMNKRLQKDSQGQLRMMTPPGSVSSVSSMPSR